jgi:hypothetical protein
VTTPPSGQPWDDLPEYDARLNQAVDRFLDSMKSYDTYGVVLKGKVVERLRRLADPPDRFPEDSIQAAAELEAALNAFPTVQFRLTNKAVLIKHGVGHAGGALQLYFLQAVTKLVQQNQADIVAATMHKAQTAAETAKTVAELAIAAFDAATAVVRIRIAFLRRFLEATDPPGSVPGIDDKTLTEIAREAAANEVLLTAGEVALDHLRLEWARHVPIATIFASLASFALDVNNEVKNLNEKRALWKQVLDAPYHPNVGDQARRDAKRIREDDEAVEHLFKSLNDTVQAFTDLAGGL